MIVALSWATSFNIFLQKDGRTEGRNEGRTAPELYSSFGGDYDHTLRRYVNVRK